MNGGIKWKINWKKKIEEWEKEYGITGENPLDNPEIQEYIFLCYLYYCKTMEELKELLIKIETGKITSTEQFYWNVKYLINTATITPRGKENIESKTAIKAEQNKITESI